MRVIHESQATLENCLTYSECYKVKYRFINRDGYEQRDITYYFSDEKGADEMIWDKFKTNFPFAKAISVKYQ